MPGPSLFRSAVLADELGGHDLHDAAGLAGDSSLDDDGAACNVDLEDLWMRRKKSGRRKEFRL